ncbi:MAG: type II toxin-antitoxin system antitoxin [Limisphaerales bacterium]
MEPRKSFLLRIDPALWRELEQWAQEELRSVNGQIEYVLRQAAQRRRQSESPSARSIPADSNPAEE